MAFLESKEVLRLDSIDLISSESSDKTSENVIFFCIEHPGQELVLQEIQPCFRIFSFGFCLYELVFKSIVLQFTESFVNQRFVFLSLEI